MHIFDIFEAWFLSMRNNFDAFNVNARFDRSPLERQKLSCSLNLQYNDHEVDLVIWESGEAELISGSVNELADQLHYSDMQNTSDLADIFARMNYFMYQKVSRSQT